MTIKLEKTVKLDSTQFWVTVKGKTSELSGPFDTFEEAEESYNKIKAKKVEIGTTVLKEENI